MKTIYTVFLKVCLIIVSLLSYTAADCQWHKTKYVFPDKVDSNSSGFTRYYDSSHVTIPRLISSASNNYGTWAVDDSGRWYLFSNSLSNESIVNGIQPSGIIATGVLPPTSNGTDIFTMNQVKVTCNLKGQVRFVSPASSSSVGARKKMYVWGFNQQALDFSGIPAVNGSKAIVKTTSGAPYFFETKYWDVGYSTYIDNQVIGDIPTCCELNWKNSFDVSMDEKYLYVVWETQTPTGTCYTNVIFAAIALDSNRIIGDTLSDGHHKYPMRIVDALEPQARRPTVSCNVYRNPSRPTCDIGFIDHSLLGGANNHPVFTEIKDGNIIQTVTIGDSTTARFTYYQKTRKQIEQDVPQINRTLYNEISQVRIVTQCSPGDSTPLRGIYLIVDAHNFSDGSLNNSPGWDNGTGFLLFHKLRYDSVLVDARSPSRAVDLPVSPYRHSDSALHRPIKPTDAGLEVLSAPIVAFANPYDGEPNDNYNEFHCIYQMAYPDSIRLKPRPLFIARGIDNGYYTLLNDNYSSINDTRTCLNRNKINDSTWIFSAESDLAYPGNYPFDFTNQTFYVGGINQMGVHVFWHDSTLSTPALYYKRNMRVFDEDITEHTLITDSCAVTDNLNVAGRNNVSILAPARAVIWTDPYYNVKSTFPFSQGAYVRDINLSNHNPSGKLYIQDSLVEFHVGKTGDTTSGATLITFPNAEIFFSKLSNRNSKIVVNQNSTLDWYALPNATMNVIGSSNLHIKNIWGVGTISLQGAGATMTSGYPSALTRPATLRIHGGAELRIADSVTFSSKFGLIDSRYELSIEPAYKDSSRSRRSGILSIHSTATIDSSIVTGRDSSATVRQTMIEVRPKLNIWLDTSSYEFYVKNSLFTNTGQGTSEIVFKGLWQNATTSGLYYRDILISGGRFSKSAIFGYDPQRNFFIRDALFDSVITYGASFRRISDVPYDSIVISNNEFLNAGSSTSFIKFEGFDKNHLIYDSIYYFDPIIEQYIMYYYQRNRISILDNLYQTPLSGGSIVGIHLINSAAAVANNVITAPGLLYGIYQEWDKTSIQKSSSFFCNNIIKYCHVTGDSAAGIKTENWLGYSKLNNIDSCDIGHLSDINDDGGILFSELKYNYSSGLQLSGNINSPSTIDIRGLIPIFPVSGAPYAANNTIKQNNRESLGVAGSKGQIVMRSHSTLKMGNWGASSSSTEFAQNNIIRNDSTDNFIFNSDNTSVSIGNADSNYWENGDASEYIPPSSATNPPFKDVTYASAVTGYYGPYSIGFVICSSGIPSSGGTKPHTQTPMTLLMDTSCQYYRDNAYTLTHGGKYQEGYELYQQYFEKCASDSDSWKEFTGIGSANSFRHPDDKYRFTEYREFLKKILYYNFAELYYCRDVVEILGTFYWFDDVRGEDLNGSNAIIKYLLESGKCSSDSESRAFFLQKYYENRQSQFQHYQDTVKDSLKTPIDTTLPSLEDLGLGILRGQNGTVAEISEHRLGELIAVRNPFTDALNLKYQLIKSGMVRIEVLDVLGRSTYSEGQGYKPKGEHLLTLNTANWSAGSYYVRLSTPNGEIKTVKVIKE